MSSQPEQQRQNGSEESRFIEQEDRDIYSKYVHDDTMPPVDEDLVHHVASTTPARKGFLPIQTNGFDRGFISVIILVAVHLFWMRFLESFLPLGFATVLTLIIAYIIIRWG